MPAPFEGTTSLPKDSGGYRYLGLWNGSVYYTWRGTVFGHGGIVSYDTAGAALWTTGNPGYVQAGDGKLVAVGTTTDAAWNGSDPGSTVIAALKAIWAKLNGGVNVLFGGTAPGLDSTNVVKSSLYGKDAVAGDTALKADATNGLWVNVKAMAAGSAVIGAISGGGIMVAATAVEVVSGTGNVAAVAATAGLRLLGYAIRESGAPAATATVYFRNGALVGDPLIDPVVLAPGESTREWFGPQGKAAASGIFVHRVSGTTHMTVHYAVVA